MTEEIAPDVFRISTFIPELNLLFNQFLVRDDEPLLFHTGMRSLFPTVLDEVARIIKPSSLRWIGFSHFESDECGALNDWLNVAPNAAPVCSFVGALVSINDFSKNPVHAMKDNEILETGKYRYRFLQTPHVPHCWEAGLMFEETKGTLFCSDLFYHQGNVEAKTESDVLGRFKQSFLSDQQSDFANAYPFTPQTEVTLNRLADLDPKTLAIMHGSAFIGDGKNALNDLAVVMREILTT